MNRKKPNVSQLSKRGAEIFNFAITNIATRRKIRYAAVILDRLDDFIKFAGYIAKATTYMHTHPKRGGRLGVIVFLKNEITPRIIYHEALHAANSMAQYLKSVSKKPMNRRDVEEASAEFVEIIIGQLIEYVWAFKTNKNSKDETWKS